MILRDKSLISEVVLSHIALNQVVNCPEIQVVSSGA
jgi:hypothetical protein